MCEAQGKKSMIKRTVSVVTPTYNSMRTFDTYMDAVLKQTYPHDNIEILFADGGSTDGTIDIIKKYLPQELSDEDLMAKVKEIIAKNQELYDKNKNALIGICIKELKSQADSSRISQVLRTLA